MISKTYVFWTTSCVQLVVEGSGCRRHRNCMLCTSQQDALTSFRDQTVACKALLGLRTWFANFAYYLDTIKFISETFEVGVQQKNPQWVYISPFSIYSAASMTSVTA